MAMYIWTLGHGWLVAVQSYSIQKLSQFTQYLVEDGSETRERTDPSSSVWPPQHTVFTRKGATLKATYSGTYTRTSASPPRNSVLK